MRLLIFIVAISCSTTFQAQSNYQQEQNKTDKSTYVNTRNRKVDSQSSVTRSRSAYQFEASFNEAKNLRVKKLLLLYLDVPIAKKDDVLSWEKKQGGEVIFHCHLEKNQLQLKLNRTLASASFYRKINQLGNELRDLMAEHATPKHRARQSMDPQLHRKH